MKLSSDCPSGSVKTAIRNLGSAAYTGGFFFCVPTAKTAA